jgi:cytoskeletal protein CcmA (bactofilin family)
VNTEHLTVAGGFSGDANVTGNLYVKSTGKVDGKVAYGNLAVEEGGVVLGTLGQDKAQRLTVPPPRQTNKRTSDSDPPDKPITSELP